MIAACGLVIDTPDRTTLPLREAKLFQLVTVALPLVFWSTVYDVVLGKVMDMSVLL